MEISGAGKSPNTSLSFRYNANNEELEELYNACDDDPPTPQCDVSIPLHNENASPKKVDKTSSIIDKYFKSMREKPNEKSEDAKASETKLAEEPKNVNPPKEVSSSPMKDYLNRLGKRSSSEVEVKEPNETWKIFHDFKFKIAQAVEDMKTRSLEGHSESADISRDDLNESNLLDVESGVEALEDTLDAFGDVTDAKEVHKKPIDKPPTPQPLISNIGLPPSKSNLIKSEHSDNSKSYFFNFAMYFLIFLLFVSYILFPNANVWNGFVLGIWFFYLVSECKGWVLDNFFSDNEIIKGSHLHLKRSTSMPATYTIPSVKEHTPMKKYESWINHYRYPEYDPYTYHINQTTTAFMKLEGCNLRISYSRTKVAKRVLWDEKIENVVFYQHRLYNLTGARILLLPKGLVKRRQWSKKYPICIVLNEKERIQVLEKENTDADRKQCDPSTSKKWKEQPDTESAETNTSPEKKKKFVWRRKEKNTCHSDGETGKEGLRHRLVRKMHRDKKPDSVPPACVDTSEHQAEKISTFEETLFHDAEMELFKSAKEDPEEEIDDTELSKIRELLEEAEKDAGLETSVEGEWSVHVKRSSDKHSHLYLFARTGRDKHEWYRRLNTAVAEANAASPETSAAEDKSVSEQGADDKNNIELSVYKLTEKETVAFAKSVNKNADSVSEAVTIPIIPASQRIQLDMESYEKTFWPYLLKIIQSKPPSPTCECPLLSSEVTWVNTLVARLIYDVMRDPIIIARLQNRIQKKLNTLKLPSFMSPLVVTELSLNGSCPLVERVASPAWDERGVWLDADLRYDGGAYIVLQTQLNLMKLKEKNMSLEDQLLAATETTIEYDCSTSGGTSIDNQLRMRKPAIYDSEVEDSAESSSDDESPSMQPVDSALHLPVSESVSNTAEGASSKKKFLKMVDKIATNKYFQQVTDYKYVKKAMEGLSNTDIKLQLEIHALEGRLTFNLPPPPHDRVWIGFRTNPQLVLKARPALGARSLRFSHISNWIEQKLSREFEKVLVLPNMEDIMVDIMTPTPVEFE
ncbi:hypothetical protein ACJJTC_003926 [Scirpophaga incertulas]